MTRFLIRLVVSLALGSLSASADLRVPKIFTDHMVLQQNQPIVLWGWAEADQSVSVSFVGETRQATAAKDGRWEIEWPPLKIDDHPGPLTLTIQAGEERRQFKDILVGEVWLASGQSNMNRPVSAAAIKQANFPAIRLFTTNGKIPRRDTLNDTVGWIPCTPDSLSTCGDQVGPKKQRRPFSEVAYHFARHLHQELKVPVGIIHTSMGGSTARDWTPNPAIETEFPFDQDYGDVRHKHGVVYQSRLHALIPYAIRGVVWYQGEDDGRNKNYAADLKQLIESWRTLWQRPDLPFFQTQIAQTTYAGGMLGVWESQAWIADNLAHTGLVPSNDIYDNGPGNWKPGKTDKRTGWPLAGGGNPHPPNRPLVAGRLAEMALARTYGLPRGDVSGPMIDTHSVRAGKVVLTFKHAAEGLLSNDGQPLNWFETSADGKTWHKAQASIGKGNDVMLELGDLPQPKMIRFAWHPLARHNLINKAGLPAIPFQFSIE